MNNPHSIALSIIQQSVKILANWAGTNLPNDYSITSDSLPIIKAKQLLKWPDSHQLGPLRLLFDTVNLTKGQLLALSEVEMSVYYWPINAISEGDRPAIPYPQTQVPTDFNSLKTAITNDLKSLDTANWNNLALLTLIIEKYGSFLSFGESDIAFTDLAKTTAALGAALALNPDSKNLSLIAGDLSGIQKFIYTISSDGALKSLRARSFYLELVTQEIVQQILDQLNLPTTNVIYAGGGNLYILASAKETELAKIPLIRQKFNQWLWDTFHGKIFLALDYVTFPVADVANSNIAKHWTTVTTVNLAKQKHGKFVDRINDVLEIENSYDPCKVCHRDDTPNLKPLNHQEPDSPLACPTCRLMFDLGGNLFKIEAIVRSDKPLENNDKTICFDFGQGATIYYHLFNNWKQIVKAGDRVFLVNNWTIQDYQFQQFSQASPVPLLLGNYAQESDEESAQIMRANELAELSTGIKRVGYLRMDVDRLGQIFAKGLGDRQTLPRIAGLSRLMSYFFKVYLNSLAANRQANLPNSAQKLTENDRPNLVFIYAGGDDLFVGGSWNEVVEFAFDVYQSFRAFTGHHPDITLSGGVSIETIKFPLYQAAKNSGEMEDMAKGNDRDSLGLFGQAFKWSEWLGMKNISLLNQKIKDYLQAENLPDLFGVFPLVKHLANAQISQNYPRSFVRNLLITAQIQDQKIQEIKDSKPEDAKDIRYYLHLPKIAYTLARLPKEIRESENFKSVKSSLLSPYNAPYFKAIATWLELLHR